MNVLAISYGRQLFEEQNPERLRMKRCAAEVAEYHMIVFSLHSHGLTEQQDGQLWLHPTNSRSRLHMLFDAYRIGKALINSDDWVVTAQDPFEAGLVGRWITKKTEIPLNVQEHGDFYSSPHWARDKFLNRFRQWFGLRVLRQADTVRVVSERIKQALIARGVSAKKVIKLPVRTDQVTNTDTVVSEKQFPQASVVVLTMGRLVSQKNVALIIDAFAALYQKDQAAKLMIVGQGDQESQLKQQVAKLDLQSAVTFLPWTDNPEQLLRQADLYAHAANWEGWGRVFIEAMSFGVPIVSTDVGLVGEAVIDNTHGFVVPVGDKSTFTQKLITLASDSSLRQQFGTAAKHDVSTWHTSLDDYAHEWVKVLESTKKAKV